MKSFRNHFSLVLALLSILFSIQVFNIVERSLQSYKDNLANNYSLVIVSEKRLNEKELQKRFRLIDSIEILSPDNVIQKLDTKMSKRNRELLKITLPKFYKLTLSHYPTPKELQNLKTKLSKLPDVKKIETFEKTHDTTYKLLLLFKNVISVFALTIGVVTILLIAKELKIWQFQHHERMSIMALFGAPTWLRSAVLFRLAIVDAIIASLLGFALFSYIASMPWVNEQFATIGIQNVVIFDPLYDFLVMLGVSLTLAVTLAVFVVLGHKEEV